MNQIFITGDIHSDPRRFSVKSFPAQKNMDKSDVVIITGDFGLIWKESETGYENYWLEWLNNKPFTTLFVDGNHENFDRLLSYPTAQKFGGLVHEIRSSVFHLMRGEIYEINGSKIFTFGGAQSHDIKGFASQKELEKDYTAGILDQNNPAFQSKKKLLKQQQKPYRINHKTWWKEEMPSFDEMNYALKNLKKHNNAVDFIITHDAPSSDCILLDRNIKINSLNIFLEDIRTNCNYKHWYFGHHHKDKHINNSETCVYEKIIRIA